MCLFTALDSIPAVGHVGVAKDKPRVESHIPMEAAK